MSDLRGLHEALQRTGIAEFMAQEETLPAHVVTVRAAARLVADLLTVCDACGGDGLLGEPEFDVDDPCHACAGRGLVVNPEAVRRAYSSPAVLAAETVREVIAAVLRALLLGDTDGDT